MPRRPLLALLGLGAASLAGAQDAPRPEMEPGFRCELIDEAPNLLWPSAVHALSDGSLLVAEDPMDMVGPPDQPSDRIWRYVVAEDGRFTRTLYAEGLYAVFGLQEVDGGVFVMNMPQLSLLVDRDRDGRAEEQHVILDDLGPPAPGQPGGFNDHIVSGLRLGMDNWLYVSVGDKGVPRATGRDGSSVQLRGGGVIRLRPDGTELELVAEGTRNHLDVAMNQLDHIFTHDNTDDGLGWWTRLSHIVPTGDYGYPWKYHHEPERMLHPLSAYGGGSPCGGLAYRGGAWPEEFEDDLFFCEWGDRVLRRFRVEPEGASYRIVSDHDFMKAVPGLEFRPLDVCESLDGRFLYVADWGYGGWRKEDRTGRLWRVRRDEPSAITPLPRLGDLASCLAALSHPSFRQRLRAQRRLRAFGEEAVHALLQLLLSSTDVRARRHAVWALDLMQTPDATGALHVALGAMRGDEPGRADTRRELLRAFGSRRQGRVVLAATEALRDPDALVRREAAIALARMQATTAVDALVEAFLADDDPVLRYVVREALQTVAGEDRRSWQIIAERCSKLEDRAAASALGLCFVECDRLAAVTALSNRVAQPGPGDRRAEALRWLASNHRRPEPWDGKWWGTQPARTDPPARTVDWEGTPLVVAAVRSALADEDATVQRAAVEAVGRMQEDSLLPLVRELAAAEEATETTLAALRVLRERKDAGADGLVAGLLENPRTSEELRREAIEIARQVRSPRMAAALETAAGSSDGVTLVPLFGALAEIGSAGSAPTLRRGLEHESAAVRVAALDALRQVMGDASFDALQPRLDDADESVRRAAIRNLGALQDARVVSTLMPWTEDPTVRDEAIRALATHPRLDALEAYLEGLVHTSPPVRAAATRAMRHLRDDARPGLEQRCAAGQLPYGVLPALQELYSEPAAILEWRLLGPFARDRFEAWLPRAEPAPATITGLGDQPCHWQEATARAEDGFLDLEPWFAPNTSCAAYAVAIVRSPADRLAEMRVGSDDGVWVWIDGEEVHRHDVDRAWSLDADRFEVRLREGDNRVVLRIAQGGGQWSFNAKLSVPGTGPLFTEQAPPRLSDEDYRAYALAEEGSAPRGRRIFFDPQGPGCAKCHAIRGEGQELGPELASIGKRYALAELIDHVLEPSRQIHESYKATTVFLKDGRSLSGLLHEDGEDFVLYDSEAVAHPLKAEDIDLRKASTTSSMPPQLVHGLQLQEFADLVRFLQSCQDDIVEDREGNDGQR